MSSKHVDGAVSDYREFRPTQALAEYLLCFWSQTIRSPVEFEQRVVPDCCVDILLRDDVPMVFGPWRPLTRSTERPAQPSNGSLGILVDELNN